MSVLKFNLCYNKYITLRNEVFRDEYERFY